MAIQIGRIEKVMAALVKGFGCRPVAGSNAACGLSWSGIRRQNPERAL